MLSVKIANIAEKYGVPEIHVTTLVAAVADQIKITKEIGEAGEHIEPARTRQEELKKLLGSSLVWWDIAFSLTEELDADQLENNLKDFFANITSHTKADQAEADENLATALALKPQAYELMSLNTLFPSSYPISEEQIQKVREQSKLWEIETNKEIRSELWPFIKAEIYGLPLSVLDETYTEDEKNYNKLTYKDIRDSGEDAGVWVFLICVCLLIGLYYINNSL